MRTAAFRTRRSRSLALTGILLVVAGCSAADVPSSSAATSSSPASSASPTDGAPTAPRIVGRVLGAGAFPSYSVEVPVGWSSGGGFVIKQGAAVIGLSVWDVVQVPSDPCHWQGSMATPGPTVDDLVQALVAQRTRNATEPAEVTLDGYSGMYIEWSVPDDMVVTGDADFAGCDVQPENGHLDFVSWLSTGGGERYQQVAGQVDRLWVLDVDGKRLVVDATYSPDATELDRAELEQVAQSLRFEDP